MSEAANRFLVINWCGVSAEKTWKAAHYLAEKGILLGAEVGCFGPSLVSETFQVIFQVISLKWEVAVVKAGKALDLVANSDLEKDAKDLQTLTLVSKPAGQIQ
jgi:hypothetical protein